MFLIHPYQLSQWLEQVWGFARGATFANLSSLTPFLGDSGIVAGLGLGTAAASPTHVFDEFMRSGIQPGTAGPWTGQDIFSTAPGPGEVLVNGAPLPLPWEHLIYAYVIESTGVFEIMAEVIRRFAVGETLETPDVKTQRWLRATEELFFREPPLFHITGLTSQLRPDMRIARRNAYWRLFGMDLAHPPVGGGGRHSQGAEQPWKHDVGVANVRFHELWLDFLRAVWTAIENFKNTSGANPTDTAFIAEICLYLRDLLQLRRRGGNLARDEFVHVATMSWLHLTLQTDNQLILDLRAMATDEADRLAKIGHAVGINPPAHARELFEMADLASDIVRFIELGYFDNAANVTTLYTPGTTLQQNMQRLIDLWEMATGDVIKAPTVRLADQPAARPVHAPRARSLAAPGSEMSRARHD